MRKSDASTQSAETLPSRPDEMQDWLNRNLYHPLALRLALSLRGTMVTPNALSIAGGAMVLLAAFIYASFDGPLWAVFALLVHMGWHVLDGADGDLARLTGRESAMGEIVDGACDYLSHVVLYLVLAAALAEQIGATGWLLMVAAGLARAVQQNFFETQRKQYHCWVYGKTWLRAEPRRGKQRGGPLMALARFYMWVSALTAADGQRLDQVLQASGEKRETARAIIKRELAPFIRSLSPLSSNYRTLVIGFAMLVSAPAIIVVFELAILSVVMVASIVRARRLIASLVNQLELRTER